jgi:hypothetical protein
MSVDEYRTYYLDLVLGTLGGNHSHFEITDETGVASQQSNRYRNGLVVLALVSLLEANFFSPQDVRCLRNFGVPAGFPANVDATHVACYLYIRDCFAHNPKGVLLSRGNNTSAFLGAVQSGRFTFTHVVGNEIYATDTHNLHLIVLRFFGQPV